MTKSKPYLETLNDMQLQAVLHEKGPLLLLAGAGSGKTRVITTKIAYLIDRKGVDPRSILAVTFTNKAAREMLGRVEEMTGMGSGVMIRTFHSFGAWMLRRNGGLIGLDNRFTIYDDDDSLTLLTGVDGKKNRKQLAKFSKWISRAKDYCLTPEDDLHTISFDADFPRLYRAYEDRLRATGAVDFGDLIVRNIELLEKHPQVAERLRQRFRYILVDEYQDSNVAQFELLKRLVGPDTYICVVGDDDQSIYRFRGAEVRNILTFPDSFPGTEIIRLEQNYRSTKPILDIAAGVVARNKGRLGKALWTRREEGLHAALAFLNTQEDEAKYCADIVSRGRPEETAILYRTNAQSMNFETMFLKLGIPYRVVGSLRFYEREEVKDALALLSLFLNPRDEVSFRRVVNKPARGVGKVAQEKVVTQALNRGTDLLSAAADTAAGMSGRSRAGLEFFTRMISALKKEAGNVPLSAFVKVLLERSGLFGYFRDLDTPGAEKKEDNLTQLINAAADYGKGMDALTAFLEDIELDRSRMEQEDNTERSAVTLITMHNTKGLEFDRVIITGLEDGLFPSARAEDEDDLEEERRIFYVAITRARNELFMTSCRSRLMWGRRAVMNPSRFIDELPPGLVTVEGDGPGPQSGYTRGARVFSGDYGEGCITRSWESGGRHIVSVQFDSGMTGKFILEYADLEIIGSDEWM